MSTKLMDEAIEQRLGHLNGKLERPWAIQNGKLHKDFVFADFVEAFAFMTRVADMAEELDHHPEWCNVYKRVSVDLITHDVDGLSDLDFTLALRMEEPL